MAPSHTAVARKCWNYFCRGCRWFFSKWNTHGADIVKGMIGALIGALLAFQVERYNRDEESAAAHLEAGLLVLATLESMEETLFANYCTNVLPHRDSKRAWLDIGVGPGELQASPELLDAPSLSFLLPSGGLETYTKLNMAQEAYSSYVAMASRRSRLLWETIYPATDPLRKARLSIAEFDRKVADLIGTSPVEQANQAAYHMLATHRYVRVISDARLAVHRALDDVLGDGKVPPLQPDLWPADREIPDCTMIEQDGYHSRVRRKPSRFAPY